MKKHLIILTLLTASLHGATTTSDSGGGAIGLTALLAGALLGGFFIYMSIVNGRKAKASLTWPSVPGEVTFSGMITDATDRETFYPSVTYGYVVNGQKFQSSQVGFSGIKSKKILTKYPKGSRVDVFFDPSKPSTAVLERGGSSKAGMFVGVAVIAASLVIGIALK